MLIEIADGHYKTLLAALRHWAEENYDKNGDCVCAPPEWFQGEQPVTKSEVEGLISDVENPGEQRFLLYDIDERVTYRDTYPSMEEAYNDPYIGMPDVIIRPFLTGGPPTQEEEDEEDVDDS